MPDFGFQDNLSFELRGENVCSNYKRNILNNSNGKDLNKFFETNSGSSFLQTNKEISEALESIAMPNITLANNN